MNIQEAIRYITGYNLSSGHGVLQKKSSITKVAVNGAVNKLSSRKTEKKSTECYDLHVQNW